LIVLRTRANLIAGQPSCRRTDCDGTDGEHDERAGPRKRAHLEQHVGSPSLAVASGGVTADGQVKLHLYWRLTEAARGTDIETVRVLRAEIARKAGGDPSFAKMHQPIRVAGSIHGKNGKQMPVRILEDTNREYHLADLVEAVEAMPALGEAPLAIDTGVALGTGRHRPS
jgi:hypothetical protein